jgi:site-specific DNA-cytosine methylase
MKVLSLFSGVGGFDMGLENAGMETVFQCEWDKHANSILHKHWPDVPKWDDVSTLTGKHILAHDEYNDSISETHHALRAGTKQSTGVLEPMMAVRRLTPLECERLMGWPDDHTRYKVDGTEQADTHRYKQCGNGVASPVAQWIAKHILNI